jgi:hypothetical protein
MGDWDTQELRIIAATAGDEPLLRAFREGHDVHTLTTCDVFGYPYPPDPRDPHRHPTNAAWRAELGWQGKKDPRRTFAKQFFYSLNYGKKPKNAIHIPGAKALGFTGPTLEHAAQRLLLAHPALAHWRQRQRDLALRTHHARDFLGARRVFHGQGEDVVRAAYDFPMQAGGVRMFNRTILAFYRQWPGAVQFKYQQHDSFVVAFHEEVFTEATRHAAAALVQRSWVIEGRPVSIPATFAVWYPGDPKKRPWVPTTA